jgi:phosphoadenosine phosphosulfate reductase
MSATTLTRSKYPSKYPPCPVCSFAALLRRNVPYNELLDKGYRSVGDWHSTAAPAEGEQSDNNERGGRWQGRNKSECGLHKDYFEMKKAFEAKQQAAQEVAVEKEAPVGV